jgi:hypothetical protein
MLCELGNVTEIGDGAVVGEVVTIDVRLLEER